ncbi:MAG TPA: hypothetical protein VI643_06440 [Planctomycetota bacterium]|nr:hypothetical protein [Planctomycetota bacterium]
MSRAEKEKAFVELAVKKGLATAEQGMRCAMEHVESQGRLLVDQIFVRNKIISMDQAAEIWNDLGGAPGLGRPRETHAPPPLIRRATLVRRATSIQPASAAPSRSLGLLLLVIGAAAVGLGAVLFVMTGGSSKVPAQLPERVSQTPTPVQAPRLPSHAAAPSPAPTPAEAPPSKEMGLLSKAEEQLASAKEMFKQGDELGSRKLLEEAGFRAEEARIKFLALQDMTSSQSVRDKLKEVNQLNKMIHDRLKSAGAPSPLVIEVRPAPAPSATLWATPPKPAQPAVIESGPAPAPTPEPMPVDVIPLLKTFAAFLEKADAPTGASDLATKLAASRTCDAQVAYAVTKMIGSGEWRPAPEEAALLRVYAKKHLSDPAVISHADAINFLLKEMELRKLDTPSIEMPATRALVLGHVASLPPKDPKVEPLLKKHSNLLGIDPVADRWVCIEGAAIEAARAALDSPETFAATLDQFKSVREPAWEIFQALASAWLAVRIKGETAMEAMTFAVDQTKAVKYPASPAKDDVLKIKTFLAKYKPCKWCKETHRSPCDYGCDENGEITKKCAVCNGSGLKPGYLHAPPCPERVPGGKHTWNDKCPKCKGARGMPCRSCKAVWAAPSADLIEVTPCQPCSGGGFLLGAIKLPCVECYGLGSRLALKKK